MPYEIQTIPEIQLKIEFIRNSNEQSPLQTGED